MRSVLVYLGNLTCPIPVLFLSYPILFLIYSVTPSPTLVVTLVLLSTGHPKLMAVWNPKSVFVSYPILPELVEILEKAWINWKYWKKGVFMLKNAINAIIGRIYRINRDIWCPIWILKEGRYLRSNIWIFEYLNLE